MLDATLDAILKQMAANPTPRMWEVGAPQARAMFAGMREIFEPKGVPIGRIDSVEIPGPGGPLAARRIGQSQPLTLAAIVEAEMP